MRPCILLCLLLSIAASAAASDEVARALAVVSTSIESLRGREVDQACDDARLAIADARFPVIEFPRELGPTVRQASSSAAALARRCLSLQQAWRERAPRIAVDLSRGKDDGRAYVRLDLQDVWELFGAVQEAHGEWRARFAAARAAVPHSRIWPTRTALQLVSDYRVLLAALALLLYVPLLTFGWRYRSTLGASRRRIACFVTVLIALALPLPGFAAVLADMASHRVVALSPLAQLAESMDRAAANEQSLGEAVRGVNQTLGWLLDYARSLDELDSTVFDSLVEFSRRVAAIATQNQTHPATALALVHQTQDQLKQQRAALVAISNSRVSTTTETDLRVFLDLIQSYEMIMSHSELQILANLQLGLDVNRFFGEQLDVIGHHVRAGSLAPCIHMLLELYTQQQYLLQKIGQANHFVTATNNAVTAVRAESTRLQPALRGKEFRDWISKTAVAVGTAVTVPSAVTAISIAGGPLVFGAVSIGATAIAALAYIGPYRYYEYAQEEDRRIVELLGGADEALAMVERTLGGHERMLTLLMEEIRSVLFAVNSTQMRVERVRLIRTFSDRERDVIEHGLSSIRSALQPLTVHYSAAIEKLFGRILNDPLQLPTP